MPAFKKVANAPEYAYLREASRAHNETNDCAVVALSLLCDVSYARAMFALSSAGRKARDGTRVYTIIDAAAALGYKLVRYTPEEMRSIIAMYPGVHKTGVKNMTTHHPRRFAKAWSEVKGRILLVTAKHVAAYMNGRVVDWSENKSLPITTMYKVERI